MKTKTIIAALLIACSTALAQFRSGGTNGPVITILTDSTGTAYMLFNQSGTNFQASVTKVLTILNALADVPLDSVVSVNAKTNTLGALIGTKQHGSANLTNWSGVAPSAKQNSLGFTPQLGSANLTNWSALSPSAKQDALGFSPQLGSANLTNWSAIATSSKQDSLGFSPQLGSANLTNWSALATSAKQNALGFNPQLGSANLTNWSAISTGSKQDALGYTPQLGSAALTNLASGSGAALSNVRPAGIDWSGLSTAAFTNGVAARIPVWTNSGTIYYLTLSTNSP